MFKNKFRTKTAGLPVYEVSDLPHLLTYQQITGCKSTESYCFLKEHMMDDKSYMQNAYIEDRNKYISTDNRSLIPAAHHVKLSVQLAILSLNI